MTRPACDGTFITIVGSAVAPGSYADDVDRLQTHEDLDAHLMAFPYTGALLRDERELSAVRAIRRPLRALWDTGPIRLARTAGS